MTDPHDPSIRGEPHLQGKFELDPSEAKAAERLAGEQAADEGSGPPDDSIWDEPALSPDLAPARDGTKNHSYANWLQERRARFSDAASWGVTLAIVLATGPWAILAAITREFSAGFSGVVAVVIIAPIVEELMKVSLPLMIVETRPYLFSSRLQILLAAIAGGAAFGLLENLIYFHFYFPGMTADQQLIRWIACLPAHTLWSLIAGIGVARMWLHCMENSRRPDMTVAAPWLITAMVLHGLFNLGAVAVGIVGEMLH